MTSTVQVTVKDIDMFSFADFLTEDPFRNQRL